MLRARPRVHARELFDLLCDRQKGCRILSAAPADGIFAALVAEREIRHFRLKAACDNFVAREEQKSVRDDIHLQYLQGADVKRDSLR
jgi:hypothetical protein